MKYLNKHRSNNHYKLSSRQDSEKTAITDTESEANYGANEVKRGSKSDSIDINSLLNTSIPLPGSDYEMDILERIKQEAGAGVANTNIGVDGLEIKGEYIESPTGSVRYSGEILGAKEGKTHKCCALF